MPSYAIFGQRGTRWVPTSRIRECGEDQMRLVEADDHLSALTSLVERKAAGAGTYRVFDWETGEARMFRVSIPPREPVIEEER